MDEQDRPIASHVKEFILNEFLPGAEPGELQGDTPLITGGILDSISTVKLVSFLETTFRIRFQAHEMDPDYLDTLDRITRTVRVKLPK